MPTILGGGFNPVAPESLDHKEDEDFDIEDDGGQIVDAGNVSSEEEVDQDGFINIPKAKEADITIEIITQAAAPVFRACSITNDDSPLRNVTKADKLKRLRDLAVKRKHVMVSRLVNDIAYGRTPAGKWLLQQRKDANRKYHLYGEDEAPGNEFFEVCG
ncbi:unnamed protein product [Amoebophrya sp. A25]|nr:unnamed protein product [Amoebophrya sp. A25]|eukprot:GSA25T00023959001.1